MNVFLSVGEALKGISNRSRGKIDCVNSQFVVSPRNEGSPQNESAVLTANSAVVMFCIAWFVWGCRSRGIENCHRKPTLAGVNAEF